MARTITITDSIASIQFVNTDSNPTPLSTTTDIMKTEIMDVHYLPDIDLVVMNLLEGRFIKLDWNNVIVPTVVSGADLYYQLMVMLVNVPSNIFKQTGTFVNADLVDGITTFVLTITHPFNTPNLFITLQDPSGNIMSTFPANINPAAPYNVTVDFGGALGAGTYSYTLIAIP